MNDVVKPRVLVGTSGYNYPEWRGTFYPEKFSTDKMLAYYAERFPTVEINYTFYRMPNEKLLAGWAAGTPDALHLHAEGAAADHARRQAAALRGSDADLLPDRAHARARSSATLLFQLPPTFKKDADVAARVHRACCPTARARRSSSAIRRGSTPTSSTSCAAATSRSASPTARS